MRQYDLRREEAKLRRLADGRSVINPHVHQAQSPPARRHLKDPPSPQGLSGSASAPNLHDFATRTHLQRLDFAYEKLDTYVEQSMIQLRSGVQEQCDKLRDWVESKIGTSREQLATALASVQSTRSVLDSAVSSVSTAQGGKNDELRARVASCEERLLANVTNSTEMRERIKTLDELVCTFFATSVDSPASPKALGDRLKILELHLGFSIPGGNAPETLEERFRELQERLEKSLEDAAPKAEKKHGFLSSNELDERVKLLEEKVDTVSGHVHQCKIALEFAVADLAEKISDKSVENESKERINEARYEGLQNAMTELRSEMEAFRLERFALQSDLKASIVEKTEFGELKYMQQDFSTGLEEVAQRLQQMLGRKTESEQKHAMLEVKVISEENRISTLEEYGSEEQRLEVLEEKVVSEDESAREKTVVSEETSLDDAVKVVSEENRISTLDEKVVTEKRSLEVPKEKVVSEDESAREKTIASQEMSLDDAKRLSLAMKHAISISEEAVVELKSCYGDSLVGLGCQAEDWIASLGQQYVDRLKNQAGDAQDKYVAFREDIERLKEKRAVESGRDCKEERSKPERDVKRKSALRLLAEASLSGVLPQMISSVHAGQSMSRAMSINVDGVAELKTLHANLFSGLGSQSEVWIASLGQRCIDELKAQAKTDQERYYASVIVFKEVIESGIENFDAFRAQVKNTLIQASRDGRFEKALAKKKQQDEIKLQVPEKMNARSQIVVTKESVEESSDIKTLSEDGPLKSFEELLSNMACSISNLEQRFEGGSISPHGNGDSILQHFVGGMDERVKKIEAMVNKTSHWIEKLTTTTTLKVPECGAEYDPDSEVCSNSGEQWKAHLDDALKQKHEGRQMRKCVREFVSHKDDERKMELLLAAFDVWARGDNAIFFKSYSEAHPSDHRIDHRNAGSRASSTSSRPSAIITQVDSPPVGNLRIDSLVDSGEGLAQPHFVFDLPVAWSARKAPSNE